MTNMCIDIAMEYQRGPILWAQTVPARIIVVTHCCTFAWITLFPLFQHPSNKPFGNTAVHLAASTALVVVSTPFANVYILPLARQANAAIPLLDIDIWHNTVLHACYHASRFLDCWTDTTVSVLLWRAAAQGSCIWYDGRRNCTGFRDMAIANIVCAAADFNIALVFVLFGSAIEVAGSRLRRVAIGLHCVALSAEFVMLGISIVQSFNVRKASELVDSQASTSQGVAFFVFSAFLTLCRCDLPC
jgi:hypothetical protein